MTGRHQGRTISTDGRPSLLSLLLSRAFLILFCLFCFIYPIAVTGVAFDVQPPFSLHWAGSILLFLEGTLLILAAALVYEIRPALFMSLLILGFSYLVEAVGVNTGLPFGRYHYTDVLFLHLPGGVPLAVLFAWVLIVFGSYAWVYAGVRRLTLSTVFLGALLAMLLDMAIEPVAAHIVDYWEWSAPGPISYYGVPLANFGAWFLVTFVLLFLASRYLTKKSLSDTKSGTRLATFVPRFLFGTSLFMFGLVDLTHGYYIATLLAVVAGGILFWLFRSRKIPQR